MEVRKCGKCFKDKLLSEFHKDRGWLRSDCKTCCNIGRGERRDRVRGFFAEYKKGLDCQSCGEGHPACLDFHHRNPEEKELNIAHATGGYRIEAIMNEISKCDVLCANCHRKLHYGLKETENDRIRESKKEVLV